MRITYFNQKLRAGKHVFHWFPGNFRNRGKDEEHVFICPELSSEIIDDAHSTWLPRRLSRLDRQRESSEFLSLG